MLDDDLEEGGGWGGGIGGVEVGNEWRGRRERVPDQY